MARAPGGVTHRAGWVGRRVKRVEDPRLLRGQARYVADLSTPGLLEAAFVRSPHAHARILSIDVGAALACTGVVGVFLNADLGAAPMVDRMTIEGLSKTPQPTLAHDRVRYVGEPVAIVVAESRYLAEDAAERVEVAYEPLPPLGTVEAAQRDGAPTLFEHLDSNVIYRRTTTIGDVEGAFRAAHRVFSTTYRGNRFVAAPMENRGCLAEYEGSTGGLTFWSSTQGPHLLRGRLARALGLPEHRVRVLAPAVGGGFGMKNPIHGEEIAVAGASMRLDRPVRWVEDRAEDLAAAPHAKEQVVHAELAVDAEGRFLAMRASFVGDAGAYSHNSGSALIEPYLAAGLMPGVYHLDCYEHQVVAVLTNKSPVAPYRGVGWTAGHTARELLIDQAARGLGLDPAELRRRNMIHSDELPFRTCTGLLYDSGTYVESLEQALAAVGYPAFRAEQAAARTRGRYLGIGVSPYVEPVGWGSEGAGQSGWPFSSHDTAQVSVDPSGKVTVAVSVSPHGQGIETSLGQLVADELGVDLADLSVLHGDTAATPYGLGTRASRSAVVAGGALRLACQQVRTKALEIAAVLLEAAPDDLELQPGGIAVRGAPQRSLTLARVAEAAYYSQAIRAQVPEPTLAASSFYDPKGTYSNGCIVAVCEVDPETGSATLRRVAAVEDCGTVLNPLIVDGQVHGAVAQGIGGALYEAMRYGEDGQPLTGSLMDYLLPTASDVPSIEVVHLESPSPFTIGGIKGMGESGVIATPAAVANAVLDALAPFGLPADGHLPLGPADILALTRERREPGTG